MLHDILVLEHTESVCSGGKDMVNEQKWTVARDKYKKFVTWSERAREQGKKELAEKHERRAESWYEEMRDAVAEA